MFRKTNFIDFNDERKALLSCFNCNLEKTLFLSANEDEDVCGCIPAYIINYITPVVNLMLLPFLLAGHFVRIYMWPAISITASRFVMKFICTLNMCSCYYYDFEFPPMDTSIGVQTKHDNRPHTISNLDMWHRGICHLLLTYCFPCFQKENELADWVRATELAKDQTDKPVLFEGGIESNDIMQGGLGDCWLMSVLASIAERRGMVERLFVTTEKSACGRYQLRLYDIFSGNTPHWRTITIDDYIPVIKGTKIPKFAKPDKDHEGHMELWVMLIEKAFAKLMGSYNAMDGGYMHDAMRVFTGCTAVQYTKAKDKMEFKGSTKGSKLHTNIIQAPDLSADELWHVIKLGMRNHMLINAAGQNRGEKPMPNGLVFGHAYSILDTHVCNGERIIQLRNPWGQSEWNGAYSDGDAKFKNIAASGKKTQSSEDGAFWMPYADLIANFNYFDLCATTVGIGGFGLNVNEEMGMIGPCYGCLEGFTDYCVMCRGVRRLYCPETRDTVEQIECFKSGGSLVDKGLGAAGIQITV
jgi:hypothetical protein